MVVEDNNDNKNPPPESGETLTPESGVTPIYIRPNYDDEIRQLIILLNEKIDRAKKDIGKLDVEVKNSQQSFDRLENKIKKARKKISKAQFDSLALISIFVTLITFLGLEIQVFKIIDNPLMVIGISMFFIASILLFVGVMYLMLSDTKKAPWKWMFYILTVLLVCAIIFICFGYSNSTPQFDSSGNIKNTVNAYINNKK